MSAAVTIVGGITRDPELRFTAGGQAICTFSVAVSRKWKAGGEEKEQTSYFDIKAWSQLAENAAASLTKGVRVVVVGRLEQETWADRETGANRSKVVIVADEIAPSLRWATVQVERNVRTEPNQATSVMAVVTMSDEPF